MLGILGREGKIGIEGWGWENPPEFITGPLKRFSNGKWRAAKICHRFLKFLLDSKLGFLGTV